MQEKLFDSEAKVMEIIWAKSPISAKDISLIAAETIGWNKNTTYTVIKKLEAKGLVSRRRSVEDERNLIVAITEKGAALREEAVSIPAKMAKCVRLEPEEALTLYRLLYKMLEASE